MVRKNISVLEYDLPVKVTPQKTGGYLAICTSWPDCYAQGDTIDEAIWEIMGVAQSLIELYKEENIKIPLKLEKRSHDVSFTIPVIVAA
ncbi:type II toxin-antitoxin system HicB family antitoxin [Candidatus Gottesmanbacteria bacterium]|nr:type II toxin-antitoxin system HicB family antitoxin [Candidatus Gottesmanbacteria bacterium]